jgi:hypothetical protein
MIVTRSNGLVVTPDWFGGTPMGLMLHPGKGRFVLSLSCSYFKIKFDSEFYPKYGTHFRNKYSTVNDDGPTKSIISSYCHNLRLPVCTEIFILLFDVPNSEPSTVPSLEPSLISSTIKYCSQFEIEFDIKSCSQFGNKYSLCQRNSSTKLCS